MKPTSSGYADVNGIKLYHEIYGQGEPLFKSRLGVRPSPSFLVLDAHITRSVHAIEVSVIRDRICRSVS